MSTEVKTEWNTWIGALRSRYQIAPDIYHYSLLDDDMCQRFIQRSIPNNVLDCIFYNHIRPLTQQLYPTLKPLEYYNWSIVNHLISDTKTCQVVFTICLRAISCDAIYLHVHQNIPLRIGWALLSRGDRFIASSFSSRTILLQFQCY